MCGTVQVLLTDVSSKEFEDCAGSVGVLRVLARVRASLRARMWARACVACPALPSVANTYTHTHRSAFPSCFVYVSVCVCVSSARNIHLLRVQREGRTESSAGDTNQSERHISEDIDRDLFIWRKPPSVCQTITFRNPRETLSADDMADFSIDQNNLPGVKEGEWGRRRRWWWWWWWCACIWRHCVLLR